MEQSMMYNTMKSGKQQRGNNTK